MENKKEKKVMIGVVIITLSVLGLYIYDIIVYKSLSQSELLGFILSIVAFILSVYALFRAIRKKA